MAMRVPHESLRGNAQQLCWCKRRGWQLSQHTLRLSLRATGSKWFRGVCVDTCVHVAKLVELAHNCVPFGAYIPQGRSFHVRVAFVLLFAATRVFLCAC